MSGFVPQTPVNSINPGVTSTNYNGSYSRSKVISNILKIVNNQKEYIPEFFSIAIIRLLRSTQLLQIGKLGSVPITTQANNLYGNTTCYWMICIINGFGNYMAVPDSVVIGYPDVSIINNLNNISSAVNLNQSNVTI